MVKTRDLVERFGCKYSHSGTEMLAYAANYVRRRQVGNCTIFMTKDVYPEVGKSFGCSASAAERRMRYACKTGHLGPVGEAICRLANED